MQEFQFFGNRKPIWPDRMHDNIRFLSIAVVEGSQQTNSDDCGCHALMNMRFLASAAALQPCGFAWQGLQMPAGQSSARDVHWRRELVEELVHSRCELCYAAADMN